MERLNRNEIPETVLKNVKSYFTTELSNYEVVQVLRASEHPDDDYLYHVIAKANEKYSCWTCWNESTQSLNFGHYGFDSKDAAMEELDAYYHTLN